MVPHADEIALKARLSAAARRRPGASTMADGARRVARLAALLRPGPGRLAYAARLALICALTALVVEIYQTPNGALTAYIAFFLSKSDRTESVLLDFVFLLLITLIIGFTTLVTMAVIDAPLWRLAAMTVISVGLLFIASSSKLRPLGGIIAMIVAYALDVLGTFHGAEVATRGLLYAWLFVGIPACVSIVVNLVFAPPPRRLAERAMAGRLQLAATMLRSPDERVRPAFMGALRKGVGEIQGWLRLAGMEHSSPATDLAALRQAALSTAAIMAWVDAADRSPAESLPLAHRACLAQTLEEMSAILARGGFPVEVSIADPASDEVLSGPSSRLWGSVQQLLEHFAVPTVSGQHVPELPAQPATSRAGFLLPDAFTNPEHIHYALKTTAAAMFCYVLYSVLDWPGIHTCFITCYVVALMTTGETVEKLTLRILGCLVGAAAGIAALVFLLPSLTSIQSLLAVVFLGALGAAWVAAGGPRIAYAGLQVAFAFFLCVIQGPAPAFDLTLARDRVIGILIGNFVAYFMFTRLWPVSVWRRVDAALAAALRQLSALSRARSPSDRAKLAAQTQAALGAIEHDLAVAEYEPVAIRPTAEWLRTRHQAAAEISALEAPLLLDNEDPGLADQVAHRLDRLACEAGGEVYSSAPPCLPAQIGVHLRNLEEALLPHLVSPGATAHATA